METILDKPTTENNNREYAGFWLRFAAVLIDAIIFGIGGVVLVGGAALTQNIALVVITYILLIVCIWLYYALMESSESQATLGKKAMGILVTDLNGGRISFGKATGRFFGRYLSGMILYIGYIMAGFTEKKQALHDILAGTLVVKNN